MIKTLALDTPNIKITDNDTPIYFTPYNDGVLANDETYTPTVYIANSDSAFTKSIPAVWSGDKVYVMSSTFTDLPVGTYTVEVWLKKDAEQLIYPDYGYVKLNINQTVVGINANLISSITVAEFRDMFNSLATDINASIDDFGVITDFKQPTGTKFVDKLNNEFIQRGINVDWFPRLASETTDDGRIQRAIDSLNPFDTLLFSSGKTYTIATGVQIKNKNNITINGNGSCINVITQLESLYVFSYVGTVDNLDIFGFTVKNINPNPNYALTTFGSNSGNTLTNSEIHHFDIYSMNVGISLNADLGGTVDANSIYRNRLHDISGSDSGKGYGIHTAYGNNTNIYENLIDNAGRHAIYIAEGFNIHVSRNVVKNHRLNNSSNNYRPAINIAREAVNITVDHNVFDNIRDSAIQIGNQNEKGDMKNVLVANNIFINWVNVPAIRIGSDVDTVGPYNSYNVVVSNNSFVTDSTFSAIVVNMGLGVIVKDNHIKYIAPAIRVEGIAITQSVQNALNDVLVKDNTFQVEGGVALSDFRAITFSGLVASGTTNIIAENNDFLNLYSDTGKNYFDYFSGSAITNPNLNYFTSRTLTKNNVAPTTGYHEVGEIVWASNPNSLGATGWICITAGSPGVWKKFGALI